MAPDTRLAQLLCARLCHDLSGSLGTLVGALDLVAMPEAADAEALSLAREAAGVLRGRLMVMRALAGSGPAEGAGIVALLTPSLAERRTLLVAALDKGLRLEPTVSAMLVAAVLLAGEALPRGGAVHLEGGAAGFRLRVEGRNAGWPMTLPAALDGAPLSDAVTARYVLAPWMVALAEGAGWQVRLGFAEGDAALEPLVLVPGQGAADLPALRVGCYSGNGSP
jgi:histidine phosphotransferase ChpT